MCDDLNEEIKERVSLNRFLIWNLEKKLDIIYEMLKTQFPESDHKIKSKYQKANEDMYHLQNHELDSFNHSSE